MTTATSCRGVHMTETPSGNVESATVTAVRPETRAATEAAVRGHG